MSRILLVDDDEPFRKKLRIALVKLGHEVRKARHGNEALRPFHAAPPDVVLTDLIMPEKEGIETIGGLRRLQPGVKIIAMSGGGRLNTVDYLEIAMKIGAVAPLQKPFAPEALAEALVRAGG